MQMIYAAQGLVSQPFNSAHQAVDIAGPVGTPIVAPEAGTVTAVGQMGSGTNNAGLVVQLGNETNGHRLCHLSRAHVSVGQHVTQGQLVGDMGYSGYTIPAGPAGSHLHWIMWRGGARVDARQYINQTHKQGGDVAEKANLDTARILAAGLLGSDGFDGRPDAHRGERDNDLKKYHVGADLTNEYIRNTFFASQQASDAIGFKRGVYAERDKLRKLVEQGGSSDAEAKLKAIRDVLGVK